MNGIKQAVECGVNVNIRGMERAIQQKSWTDATNSMLVIDSLLRAYERSIGAVRIG